MTLADGRELELRPAAARDRRRAAPAPGSRAPSSTASTTCARSPTATCCASGWTPAGTWSSSARAGSAASSPPRRASAGSTSPSSIRWRCRTSGSSAPRSAPSTATCTASTASSCCSARASRPSRATGRSRGCGPPAGRVIDCDFASSASASRRASSWPSDAGLEVDNGIVGRRAPADLGAERLRRRRRGERLASVLPRADPGRALGQRAQPGPGRGPGDARRAGQLRPHPVLLLRPVRRRHGVLAATRRSGTRSSSAATATPASSSPSGCATAAWSPA